MANPKQIWSVFSETIPIDSIAPYFNINDFFRFLPNKIMVGNFIDNNCIPTKIPIDVFNPYAQVLQKSFIDSRHVKAEALLRFDSQTFDTLQNTFVRITRPGFNNSHDSALIYMEFYYPTWDCGMVFLFSRKTGYWEKKSEMFLWANHKTKMRDLLENEYTAKDAMYDTLFHDEMNNNIRTYVSNISNVEEDTVLNRTRDELESDASIIFKKVKMDYRRIFSKPRPKGTIYVTCHINCLGTVYDVSIQYDKFLNDELFNNLLKSFLNSSFSDNSKTSRCGKTRVLFVFKFQ